MKWPLMAAGLIAVLVIALLVAVRPGSTNAPVVRLQNTAATPSQVQEAINWADGVMTGPGGGSQYAESCLNFVYEAWKSAGVDIGGYFTADTPALYWRNDPVGWAEHGSGNPPAYNPDPPAGALVFWDVHPISGVAEPSHVALSLGGGAVISSWAYPYADRNKSDYDVFPFNLSLRNPITYKYLGYIMPLQYPASTPTPTPTPTPLSVQPAGSGSQVQPAGSGSQVQPAGGGSSLQPTSGSTPTPTTTSTPTPIETPTSYPPPNPPLVSAAQNGNSINFYWNGGGGNGLAVSYYYVCTSNGCSEQSSAGSANIGYGCGSPTESISAYVVDTEGHQSLTSQAGTTTQACPPPTYYETVGGPTHTWTDYANAGGTEGPTINTGTTVQVTCRLTGYKVADGNTWWYQIASSPWNNTYYASADAFYNNGDTSGSLSGTPFVDTNVPVC
jgi:hypothetical protein